MKENSKYIILVVLFVAILAVAGMGYKNLSKQYAPDNKAEGSATKQATDFTVYNEEGEAVKLSDSFGKPIVVNFWATWCGPCKSELPAFDGIASEYSDEVTFMMVNMTDGSRETVDVVKEFLEETGYTFPVYYDTEFSAAYAYSVYSIPTTLFIDADGTVAATHKGPMTEEILQSYINDLLEK